MELIAATTITGGLRIVAKRDTTGYRTGVKVRDEQLAAVPLRRHEFHGGWNYSIEPTMAAL